MRDAANSIGQGIRDEKSPLNKLNSELGTNITSFFGKEMPGIEEKIQKHIDAKIHPKKKP